MYVCIYFRAAPTAYLAPGQGSNQSCSRWPTPQPQQGRIRATSVTYTTAHGKARSLTHWMRPGIEPASSWLLLRFVTTELQQELLASPFTFTWKCFINENIKYKHQTPFCMWFSSHAESGEIFTAIQSSKFHEWKIVSHVTWLFSFGDAEEGCCTAKLEFLFWPNLLLNKEKSHRR